MIHYASKGLLIAIEHERALFFPLNGGRSSPKSLRRRPACAVLERSKKIQQHTWAVPNPCSTMCLFSLVLKQRTQICEKKKKNY